MNTLKSYKSAVVLLLAGAFAAGCTLPPEEDPVLLKLDELDQRVGAIERVVSNESLLQIAAELDLLRDEVRELRGHTEALQHEAESGATRQRDQYLDLDQRLQSLERRTRGGEPISALPPSADRPPLAGATSAPPPAYGADDRSSYQAALELLRQGRYPQAEAAFKQFFIDFPDSELGDNAQYWLAETHYVNREFETALAAFRQVLEQYPNTRKAPDAMLKAGFCEYELGRWADARASLETIVAQHPDSTAARLANQRLERMRAERR